MSITLNGKTLPNATQVIYDYGLPEVKAAREAGVMPFQGTCNGEPVEFYLMNLQGQLIGTKKKENAT